MAPQAADASSSLTPLEQGQLLSKQAYAEPPIVPTGLALSIVIVILIFTVLSTIVIALRIYVRAWMEKTLKTWGWEDTFIVLGYGTFLSSAIFAIKACFYGLGSHDSKLNPLLMIRCAEYMMYSNVIYGFSMPLIKASIVFTLNRITTTPWHCWGLYGMLFMATIMAIVGILATLLYCHPVPAYWNPLLGTCGDFMVVVRIGYAWTAIGIVTDWTCAILPYFIVRNLQMASRQKLIVMLILGLGAVASTATIVRAPYLKYYLVTEDRLSYHTEYTDWNGYITLWCLLESGIALIAACLPALRILVRKYVDASKNGSSGKSHGYGTGSGAVRSHNRAPSTQLDTLTTSGKATAVGGQWERLEDDNSSSRKIMQKTTIYVETDSMSDLDRHSLKA
ncbi:GPCR, PTH11-type [Trichoderma citrinoviride]|uniref:GPCR, PTH11-type n=1 Tax=Trichoderma citrinoviride TaxID=58853 RepID=A0A2T4AXT3_9HYPO|nr:GPCR, PTH11-type [Trichoderma citrinoviride]PTB61885.1 GPCR, PTH11-type [Trichoderma citrinoviride]